MPKAKSNRAAAKRFKVTGTGKIRRRQSGRAHLKVGKKTSRQLRRLAGEVDVSPGDRRRARKLLGK
jgi:large subunit ribosomal protein L35